MDELRREASLADLFSAIWRARWLVLSGIALGAAFGLLANIVLQPRFTATVLVKPVDEAASGGLGALASQFGGLASLAGIAIGGKDNSEALAILQSEVLASMYIQRHDLMPVLFAKRWDASAGQWKTADSSRKPTLWRATQFFKKRVRKVTEDRKTGYATLTVEWTDPKIAADWANGLVQLADDYLREQALKESSGNIAYLKDRASKTDVVEERKAIFSLLEAEVNREMMARGRGQYALRVIDPAVAPEKPTSLGAVGRIMLGMALGFVLTSVFAVARGMFVR